MTPRNLILLIIIIDTIIILFCPRLTLATDASVKFGLGMINSKLTSQVKPFSLREEIPVVWSIKEAKEIGMWSDTGKNQGRTSSGFGQYELGVKPESDHFYVKAFYGLALITSPDSQLGGIIQFGGDAGFGFQDKLSFVGLNYKHISSAGLEMPNKGRDNIQLECGVRY